MFRNMRDENVEIQNYRTCICGMVLSLPGRFIRRRLEPLEPHDSRRSFNAKHLIEVCVHCEALDRIQGWARVGAQSG